MDATVCTAKVCGIKDNACGCTPAQMFRCQVCRRTACWCAGGDSDDRFRSGGWCNDCWLYADQQLRLDESAPAEFDVLIEKFATEPVGGA